jgi:beta-lactamase regulating signal transducer with metallopeptidase domain
MTTIEVGAILASAMLVKATVTAAVLIVSARLVTKSASSATLILGLGHGALGLILVLSALMPSRGSGFVSIPHEALQSFSIGSATVAPVFSFIGLWAAGVGFLLWRFVRDVLSALALASRADGQAGRRAGELLQRSARAIGVARLPELRETSELATAALIGFWRPVLLVPRQAREWSDEELFGVFCHELEHARRNDWLWLIVERIVTAVFWINPLVHVLGRVASGARERSADDAALRAGAGATAYASRLISVARNLKTAPRLAVSVAFADGGRIDQRVRALFEPRDRRGMAPMAMLRVSLVAVPLVVGLAAVEPWTCLPSAPPTSEACP